jgi:hypothetical protein
MVVGYKALSRCLARGNDKNHKNVITWNAVAQLADALRYQSEGSRFDSRWSHWTQYIWVHYGCGVD